MNRLMGIILGLVLVATASAQTTHVNNLQADGNINANGNITSATGTTTANIISLTSRDCRADGYVADGVTDDSAAVNTCIANAKSLKQTHILLPCGTSVWTANTINGTNFPGIHISGCGWETDATNPPTQGQGITNIICNQGTTKACISLVGSSTHELDHMTINLAKGVQGAGIAIVEGRDNAGGGGAANPLCFSEGYNIHDVYITDNGGSNPALNSGRGFLGIYNVSAENGIYTNLHILADTTILASQNNVLGYVDPYQTIQTGCPLSMTGMNMIGPVLTSSSTTLPLIEANTTEGFRIHGIQGVGGAALVKFENTAGASPTDSWTITGLYEQGSSDIVNVAVSIDNMDIYVLIAIPPPGFDIKMGANSLAITQSRLIFDSTPAGTPFIDNVSTGTTISGSTINIGGATSASNTTVTSSQVFAQGLTDAQITFNAASSNYNRYTSSGISTVGPRRADRFLAGDGNTNLTAYGETSDPTTGMFFITSNIGWSVANATKMQLGASDFRFGSGMSIGFASTVAPGGSSADTNWSRCGPGVSCFGTGAQGSTAGTVEANQLQSTVATGTAPLIVASTTVVPNLNASTLGGATFAAPGPIGGTTPGSAAHTTISATGQITSTLATGTAPLVIASTTAVPNLKVQNCDTCAITTDLLVTETTAPAGAAGKDVCYGDSTAHALKCSYNNGTFGNAVLSAVGNSAVSDVSERRYKANQGTAFSGADAAIVLSAGFGTGAAVSAATGFDQAFSFSVTAGTTPGANPTITVTFKDGTWTAAPQCIVSRNDITTPFNTPPHTWTTSATQLVVTFNGTPTAANVYKYVVMCMGN